MQTFFTIYFAVAKNGTISPSIDLPLVSVTENKQITTICDRDGLKYITNPSEAILVDKDFNEINGHKVSFKTVSDFLATHTTPDVQAVCGIQTFSELYNIASVLRVAYIDKPYVGAKLPLSIESENYGVALTTGLTAHDWIHLDSNYVVGTNPYYMMHFRRKGVDV